MESKRARLPRGERRDQLLGVGREVFAARGFEAATLEEIAERAGVSRPILYSHFGDKKGLFEAVVNREVDAIQAVVTQAIAKPGKPREQVERGLRAFFQYVQDQPEGHAVLNRDAPVHLSNSGLGVMHDDLASRVTEVVAEAMDALGVDRTPAPIFAHALIGLGAHVGRWWQRHPEFSLDAVTQYSTAMVWSGLGGLIREQARPR